MSFRVSAAAFVVLASTAPVTADEPTPAGAEPKVAVGVGLAVWLPQGDVDDFVDESFGLRPVFTYWIRPFIGVTATFDFLFVNEKENVDSTTYYALSVGARLTTPKPATVKPYGEILLGQHHLENDAVDDSAIGLRIGGGASFATGDRLVLHAGITYSSASIDAGFVDLDVDALVPEFVITGRF